MNVSQGIFYYMSSQFKLLWSLLIGCRIVEGDIDIVIFLSDPLEAQPHDPDIKALLRIAVVYDVPIANNLATADFLLASSWMNEVYNRKVENYAYSLATRFEKK